MGELLHTHQEFCAGGGKLFADLRNIGNASSGFVQFLGLPQPQHGVHIPAQGLLVRRIRKPQVQCAALPYSVSSTLDVSFSSRQDSIL